MIWQDLFSSFLALIIFNWCHSLPIGFVDCVEPNWVIDFAILGSLA
jgi:hypothetical protein